MSKAIGEGRKPFPIHKERWDFRQGWLDYVNKNWIPGYRAQQIKDHRGIILEFKIKADQSFRGLGLKFRHIKTWVSIQLPDDGEGYSYGYPHIHYPLRGTTLVHYLDPGDQPAPLHIIVDGEVVEKVYPERGLTVFMPNDLEHGVLKNNGTTNRVQMIATAL